MVAGSEELEDIEVVDCDIYGRYSLVVRCFVALRDHCVTISHEGVIIGEVDTEQSKLHCPA